MIRMENCAKKIKCNQMKNKRVIIAISIENLNKTERPRLSWKNKNRSYIKDNAISSTKVNWFGKIATVQSSMYGTFSGYVEIIMCK